MNSDMISYYKERAKEYEKIYNKPERQNDLMIAEQILQEIFSGKNVFEIACGTGYWTEKISKTARSIVATDINDTVIEVAKSKTYSTVVSFKIADIFNVDETTKFDSLFGAFIWSHIKLQNLENFINISNRLVESNGTVVFIDNNYVEGSSSPVTYTDDFGNTYQTRKLENDTIHRVLKNFPAKQFIRELLGEKVSDIKFISLHYYWILKYTVN
jgi:demethylmenaquinone methyltransferase/2-methoxy-6-polyprenyl-1,4-benzoquinol methylase